MRVYIKVSWITLTDTSVYHGTLQSLRIIATSVLNLMKGIDYKTEHRRYDYISPLTFQTEIAL